MLLSKLTNLYLKKKSLIYYLLLIDMSPIFKTVNEHF